ncbi:hypothetical protein ACFQO1_12335 [Jejudonia soesokkakensis]|uniref:Uncharacterized protein n=1 Tax=Jejudonia soesokkakensis TaxID=1323432 RepID=A0ABW2MXK3_9FLAO
MQKKWYVSALLVVLTLVGVSLGQMTVPNQEIVVQFSAERVSSEDAKDTIEIVRSQLESLGAEHITVSETASGLLKITYYSIQDVALIKRTLAKEQQLDLGVTTLTTTENSDIPAEGPGKLYELEVHEITQLPDYDSDINGVALTLESKTTRFYVQDVNFWTISVLLPERIDTQEVAYQFQKRLSLLITTPHFIIPEVRAGPLS